jgi:N-methylhydantoinase B
VRVTIARDPERVEVDLRDNPDNYAGGMNSSEATAKAGAIAGVVNSIPVNIPLNAGSFRRIDVLLREGCMAGIPRFPHSCSVASTEPFERIVAAVQTAFAEFGDGYGVAEGAVGQPPSRGVISGEDPRRDGASYINQIFIGSGGGPASAQADGWPTYTRATAAAVMFHDSVEIDEQRYPLNVESRRLVPDSGGAGRFRGGLGTRTIYRAKLAPMTVGYMIDGHVNVPKGVRGGDPGARADASQIDAAGREVALPKVGMVTIDAGGTIIAQTNGGGGYGDPLERSSARVLEDVLEGWVTREAARDRYGVVIVDSVVDEPATAVLRAAARQ